MILEAIPRQTARRSNNQCASGGRNHPVDSAHETWNTFPHSVLLTADLSFEMSLVPPDQRHRLVYPSKVRNADNDWRKYLKYPKVLMQRTFTIPVVAYTYPFSTVPPGHRSCHFFTRRLRILHVYLVLPFLFVVVVSFCS
jgi:hypothetical protein